VVEKSEQLVKVSTIGKAILNQVWRFITLFVVGNALCERSRNIGVEVEEEAEVAITGMSLQG
jgi:hypothetical protein